MPDLAEYELVLYDDAGIIAQGPEDEVRSELSGIERGLFPDLERKGDLVLAQIIEVHG